MRLPSVVRPMVVGALMLVGVSAQGAHQLAYSKNMGVTVFAEGGAQWCDRQLQLTIDADNAGFFQSPDLQRLLQVLGTKVLASDCALATAAQIKGRYEGATVWQVSTSKHDGWVVQEMAAEKPAAVETPARQESPQAAVEDVKADEAAAAPVPAQQAVVEPPPTEAPTAAPAPVQPSVAGPAAPTAAPAPGITTTPRPATEAVAAAEPAVAAADFAVAGWTPEPALKQAEGELDSVASKDERCAVHCSVRANDKGLVYLESDLPCVDGWIHGSGKALIKRVDGKQIAQMKGNFSRGFFTAQDDLDPGSVVGVNTEPPNNLLVLLKTDRALKAYYVGNVAVIGANRWGLCHYAQVRLVTEDQDLFLDEKMIDTVVESAAELVSRACPTQRGFRFSAGATPWDFDKQDHNVNYYVTRVDQDRRFKAWSFNNSRAWNGVIAARIAKAEQERLEDKGGMIDDEGVYFVVGHVTGGEQRDEGLPIVTMVVEKAWLCKERLCNDHGDVLGMVKTRHDFPDFDPEQQPEQPRWR